MMMIYYCYSYYLYCDWWFRSHLLIFFGCHSAFLQHCTFYCKLNVKNQNKSSEEHFAGLNGKSLVQLLPQQQFGELKRIGGALLFAFVQVLQFRG